MKVPVEKVRSQILSIFDACGMDPGLARTAAEDPARCLQDQRP